MIELSAPPPALESSFLSLFHTNDVLLGNLSVFVFYGPSTTGNSTQNNSRIQAHIFSLAGFQSFPRLTIAPTSPLYAAVNHLPADQQGDEISRGLAVSLLSYFAGLSAVMKSTLRDQAAARRLDRQAPMMFDEMHAGDLASNMMLIEDSAEIARFMESALAPQFLSWVDVHVVLPSRSIERAATSVEESEKVLLFDDNGLPLFQFGQYDSLVNSLGSPAFLPTSILQRAPSRPTVHGKGKTLSKEQKIALRRELCELVDTEKSYVDKLSELVNSTAVDFRQRTRSTDVLELFPESLSRILETNESFYSDMQMTLDETENEAIEDIENCSVSEPQLQSPIKQSRRRDPTGTTSMSKIILKWLPKFLGPYQDYLRASAKFSNVISNLLEEHSSSVSRHLQDFGEQRLRSALIEPVQRLPRYSLFIDNMINLLPASHPALASLLKARDIVTDICALDAAALSDRTRSATTMRNLVTEWPTSLAFSGRLITAVDVTELKPPYLAEECAPTEMLLLFADVFIVLRKFGDNPMSARGITAEFDRSTSASSNTKTPESLNERGLLFLEAFNLFDLRFYEFEDGRSMRMTVIGQGGLLAAPISNMPPNSSRVFTLLGPYDGKAARFSEEITKARIESCFSDEVRSGESWAMRSLNPSTENLGMYLALCNNSSRYTAGVKHVFCQVQISIDESRDIKAILEQNPGTNVVARVTTTVGGYHLETGSADGVCHKDACSLDNIVAVLLMRLNNLVRLEHHPQSQTSVHSQILLNQEILRAIPFERQHEEETVKSSRPLSPVKIISNLLNSVSLSHPNTPTKHRHNTSVFKDMPSIPPPVPSKSNVQTTNTPIEKTSSMNANLVDPAIKPYRSPLALLEESFDAYMIALRSRSGNVVGKILRGRATANELAVNELYNILLEDPTKIKAAAEVSIDVLFAAFEKFVQRAWREQMGPLLPAEVLQRMQSAFDLGKPVVFMQEVKRCLDEMSPQSMRAFARTLKLLSDLLDASGSDGDRGALMASFAEALFLASNPHDYIMLLDRLLDDYESLFDEYSTDAFSEGSKKSNSDSLTRSRSTNTSSISSNTSSLRKKFGFGTLTRENSRCEAESKTASIWRTLSKNSKGAGDSQSQPSSISKASGVSLSRSRSTDTDPRMLPPLGPVSRDRPTSSGSASRDESRSRPGSSHLNSSTLSSIGENTPTKPTLLSKKKRRSSLSDLKLAHEPAFATTSWSPLQLHKTSSTSNSSRKISSSPKASTQIRQSPRQLVSKGSAQPSALPQRFGSPQYRENSPLRENVPPKASSPTHAHITNKQDTSKGPSEVIITKHDPQKRSMPRSGIPALKGGLTERAWPPNSKDTLGNGSLPSLRKLRMNSPQKIRERLSQEKKSLTISDESFQAEMAKISDEMARYKIQRSPTKARSTVDPSRSTLRSTQPSPTLESLSSQMTAISARISDFTESQKATFSSISSDLESSLIVSENKARKLDELYREANAENEALYERFNDELGKILAKVRKGEGVDEMKSKLKEAQEEVLKLKRENARLKRESVVLKSRVREE